MIIDLNDPQMESKLRSQEQEYARLRASGEEAPAKILTVSDTGVRWDGTASLLEFYVEVYPDELPPFNAATRHPVPDQLREKFSPGLTIFVKYDPEVPKDVAIDHTPVETTILEVECSFCGAPQTLIEGQSSCIYCGMPLKK